MTVIQKTIPLLSQHFIFFFVSAFSLPILLFHSEKMFLLAFFGKTNERIVLFIKSSQCSPFKLTDVIQFQEDKRSYRSSISQCGSVIV